ncbi:phosphatidylserine lipase ABHD16A-like isoform X1 [Hydractinia symbiolongicarpus]|uniref:phosphatidylserine lipase ABHD16A-like isoform X1 n=2 Tax=Hydractinia symbiolongicarpus TaxID=13093 RepID=UPI00254FB881|nr:phosphatidylserine lipase ABHD16A-like isoform X1 [Hydractinia symbiolongicarpus]
MAASGTFLLSKFADIGQYIFGPRLYRLYQLNTQTARRVLGRQYVLTTHEWLGESFIRTVSYALSVTYYFSPFIAYYVYQKGIFSSTEQLLYYMKFCTGVVCGLAIAYVIRGYGRWCNNDYRIFHGILTQALRNKNERGMLQLYDFEFSAWPVDFRYDESVITSQVKCSDTDVLKSSLFSKLFKLPYNAFEYFLAHALARPMAFPGSIKLLQAAMGPALSQGRWALIEKNGLRAKLLTKDGNEIDTMFIDRRSERNDDEGNTLVICCEGNAAFYEVGCMGTPLKGGYSVLGWNHPGFLGSTGLPFPNSEEHAIDVVVQYAVTRLGFRVDNIIMFAWSIGGYTAAYAAMMYPDIKALILDATFDDINQLALTRMPAFAGGIVKSIIRNYMSLNNTKHVIKFPGPIRLIRRQREEIITTTPNDPGTNRGNFLLVKLLMYRYPLIISKEGLKVLWQYLCAADEPMQVGIIQSIGGINEEECEAKLAVKDGQTYYPSTLGQDWSEEEKIKVTLYLAMKYMDHFDATHCMPLPYSYFQLPWQHSNL